MRPGAAAGDKVAHDIEPVLIQTSAGVVGAIITLPACRPRGAVAIMHGRGSTHAGLNRVWAMLAASLAEAGISEHPHRPPGHGGEPLVPAGPLGGRHGRGG